MENFFCVHCFADMTNRLTMGRGLCSTCWKNKAIRVLYPVKRNSGGNGVVLITSKRDNKVPAPDPTSFLPGSPGKIAVLEERARLGQPLWVDGDARFDVSDLDVKTLRALTNNCGEGYGRVYSDRRS